MMDIDMDEFQRQFDGDFSVVEDGDHVVFSKTCSVSKKPYSLKITREQFVRWKVLGGYAQDVFPRLSADEREFLISHQTPAEFEAMFAEMDHADYGD